MEKSLAAGWGQEILLASHCSVGIDGGGDGYLALLWGFSISLDGPGVEWEKATWSMSLPL